MSRKTTVYKIERHKWPDEIAKEKRQTRIAATIVCVAIVCFLLGSISTYQLLPRVTNTSTLTTNKNVDKFSKIYTIMTKNWYFSDQVEDIENAITDSALLGVIQSDVDKHTYYMKAEKATDFKEDLTGSISGIGIKYSQIGESFIVQNVFPDSGAAIAGIEKGDELLAADGVSFAGKTTDDVVNMVRGEIGTTVDITILRDGKEFTLTCRRMSVDTSTNMEIIDDVAVIEISSFAESTGIMMAKKLGQIHDQGITKVIFDLRNDGGGYLSALRDLGNLLVPNGTVLIQQKYQNGTIQPTVAENSSYYSFDKIVVLINEQTASAAEVFAALMKEKCDATVIGKKSYGKGTVQTSYTFDDGSMFKYTIAEWLTSEGNSINNVGISPDIEVDNIAVYNYISDF